MLDADSPRYSALRSLKCRTFSIATQTTHPPSCGVLPLLQPWQFATRIHSPIRRGRNKVLQYSLPAITEIPFQNCSAYQTAVLEDHESCHKRPMHNVSFVEDFRPRAKISQVPSTMFRSLWKWIHASQPQYVESNIELSCAAASDPKNHSEPSSVEPVPA